MSDTVDPDGTLESTTKDPDVVTLCAPPDAPEPIRPTLETLPNELLLYLFSHLGPSFVLPPLSARLLPFHRSQLYRKVTVDLYQFDIFQRTLQSNKALCGFVEDLTLKFHSGQTGSKSTSISLSQPATLRHFVRTLPNLKALILFVDNQFVLKYYPKPSDFANNIRLETFAVRSYGWTAYKSYLDWEELRNTQEQPASGELYEEQVEPDVQLELWKRSDQLFGLRYLTMESTEINIHSILREFPLSRLQLVAFTHSVHLGRLLQNVGHPLLLTRLSLFSFDQATTNSSLAPGYLSRFPNLTHLALGGTALLTSPEFYDSLSHLPLESLNFGLHSDVRAQVLIDVVSDESKLTSLKRLVLDNFDSEAPSEEEEEDANLYEWELPDWTPECSAEKVKELMELAEKLGIEIEGSTIRGLQILESEAYQAALEREEDEEDEEDPYEAALHGEYEDESGDSDAQYEDLHERWCGCHRHWGRCPSFGDDMGWNPSRYEI
ncbi:uncharacterized protein JCM6883_007555 [Sporobolomyces salmoneus]|uniref:uncharacterized protein n=1 Tax=Sporobolomyces salmoneus TaxID=183962 RepID=UPI0031739E78